MNSYIFVKITGKKKAVFATIDCPSESEAFASFVSRAKDKGFYNSSWEECSFDNLPKGWVVNELYNGDKLWLEWEAK